MKKYLLSIFTLILPLITLAQETEEIGLDQQIDQAFQPISNFFSNLIFFQIGGVPFVLILLVFSAAFFTIYFKFPNIKKNHKAGIICGSIKHPG